MICCSLNLVFFTSSSRFFANPDFEVIIGGDTGGQVIAYVGALPIERALILSLIIVIYLILGCFLDQIAILVLTVPITLPIVTALGYDPLWFGIVVTLSS